MLKVILSWKCTAYPFMHRRDLLGRRAAVRMLHSPFGGWAVVNHPEVEYFRGCSSKSIRQQVDTFLEERGYYLL